MPTLTNQAIHHFTVDVEEYFQVSAMESSVPRARWPEMESRVCRSMDLLLDILDQAGAKGTFFVLGMVAESHPDLVREIAARGHEVASHGWGHRRVTTLRPEEFRTSVRRSKQLLEALSGQPVIGYRAPSFSITRGREWALDVLIEEGYRYDSSLFPTRRPGYGHPDAPSRPTWLERSAGRILEVPLTVFRAAGIRIPAAGGAYFRLLPYGLTRAALRQKERWGEPGTFYIHPWELDPDQPRIPVPFHTRVRHYGGLSRTESRLRRLLEEFRFGPVNRTLEAMCPTPS
jgi:polysaccharide deacetylase family protein (PEP-CTERM system associated)